jgi:hypothetical protein
MMGQHQQCTLAQAMEQLATQWKNDQQCEGTTKKQHEGIMRRNK